MNEVLIFGHKKPDTDSVTSAIALAYYKRQLGINAKPYILGNINRETDYVLKRFGISEPEFLNDTKLQIKDINYHKDCMIKENETILNTYKYMIDKNITGIPLVDDKKKFKGLVTSTMICKNIIDGNSKELNASLINIAKTINGIANIKFDKEINGPIVVNNESDTLNAIHITNTLENTLSAISNNAKLIIMTDGIPLERIVSKVAKENKINIIKTQMSMTDVLRNINLSENIISCISMGRFEEIDEEDYYDDFLNKSTKLGFNNYPVINKDGKCTGFYVLLISTKLKEKK